MLAGNKAARLPTLGVLLTTGQIAEVLDLTVERSCHTEVRDLLRHQAESPPQSLAQWLLITHSSCDRRVVGAVRRRGV